MAWSGSGPGGTAAPYQQPAYTAGQAQYQQPPYSQAPQPYSQPPYSQAYQPPYAGQPPVPTQAGPPSDRPPKKKGNPVITRYPPPPGYQGPYQASQPGYQAPPQSAYPQSYQHTNYQAPPAAGYPQQAALYQPPAGYQPSAYPSYPQGYAAQGYNSTQVGYQAPQGYPQPQAYPPQQGAYQYPQPGAPVAAAADPNAPPYQQPAQPWQPPYQQPYPSNDNGYSSQPSQEPLSAAAQADVQPKTDKPNSAKSERGDENGNDEKPEIYLGWDDWDFDFDGAIWPKGNEPIDPNLSLGVLIWHPAKQVTRALPSTYYEAEENALKPPLEKLGNAESVSMYFTLENAYEARLTVRDTDDWPYICNDPAFIEFPEGEVDMIAIKDVIRERRRPDWEFLEEELRDDDKKGSDGDIMNNLEKALNSGQTTTSIRPAPGSGDGSSSRVRTEAGLEAQEDILSKLGVSGSPKPVQNTQGLGTAHLFEAFTDRESVATPTRPPRPFGDRGPPRANSYGYRKNSYGQLPPPRGYSSLSYPRPPPPPQHSPPVGSSWKGTQSYGRTDGRNSFDGSRNGRDSFDATRSPQSDGSHRTLAGSDFGGDENNAAEQEAKNRGSASEPRLERTDSSTSRKRSYDDGEQEEGNLRQHDDYTPRNKRRQPQVAAAYSRR